MFSLTHLGGFGAFTPASSSSGYIQSIQAFEITIAASSTSNTATISSVNTANAVIFFGGFTTPSSSSTLREFMPRAELTNGTTVTVYRDTSNASTVTVRGTVVEFVSSAISSVQHGTLTIAASSTSGTTTISSVDTSRAVLLFLGNTNTTTTTTTNAVHVRLDLTDSTTITATRASAPTAVITVGFVVVEFAASVVSSVQKRSVTLTSTSTSSTDTITSVNTANTLLCYNGATCATSTVSNYYYNLQLTDSSTVTLTRTGSSTTSRTINYTVLEFVSDVISTVQRGTTAINSVTSADTTITSVNTSKALCNYVWHSTNATTTSDRQASQKLLNDTTVRGEKGNAGTTTCTPGWEVVEFV